MNSWVSVFSQSPVNNAPYDGDRLPQQFWQWPTGTWFQTRVRRQRKRNRRAAQSTGDGGNSLPGEGAVYENRGNRLAAFLAGVE